MPRWLAILPWLLPPLGAQQYSRLTGVITDPAGHPVAGAAVSITSEDTGFRRATYTFDSGSYSVSSLQPGPYKIIVRKQGFPTLVRMGVKLDVAQTARVDFELRLDSLHETITIEGNPIAPNTEDASVGTFVGREWIDKLPINGRGLLNLLEMAPGSVVTPATRGEAGQFTVNGQRPNTHYFSVDGVSVNTGILGGGQPALAAGGSLPSVNAFGGLHSLVSLEALDEFRLQTSSTAAEFGRMPGAQVSLGTRSGSNELHGSVFLYGRNAIFDANDWFANRHGFGRAPTRMRHLGGSAGGPLRRNRSFFFFAYEDLAFRQSAVWRSPVPVSGVLDRAPGWAYPLVGLFPAGNGITLSADSLEWIGRSNRPASMTNTSLRLDHSLTPKLSLFARYGRAPSASQFGSSQVNTFAARFAMFTVGLNARLGARLVNDLRGNFVHASADSAWSQEQAAGLPSCYFADVIAALSRSPQDCHTFFRLSVGGLGQLASGQEAGQRQRQWNVTDTANLSGGSHSWRFGGDYRRIAPERLHAIVNSNVMVNSIEDLLNQRNIWVTTSRLEANRLSLSELSLFLQDTWRIHSRLTLTYGVRWEFSASPGSLRPPQGLQLPKPNPFSPPVKATVWGSRYDNIAPRFGLALQLSRSRNTVLRTGFGAYYESSLAIATDLLNDSPHLFWQLASPVPDISSPTQSVVNYGFAPGLRLPKVWQWNVTLEQPVGRRDLVSAGYVGARGVNLLRREMDGVGGVALVTNHGSSDYHALQLQWRRRLARFAQVSASYAWSHSIDTASTDSLLHWVSSSSDALRDRASSDFDLRQSLNLAFSLNQPEGRFRNWSLDGVYRMRSGFPIALLQSETALGVAFANAIRPNYLGTQPVWLDDPNAPGGHRINPGAFASVPGSRQGSLGRNALDGFGMSQFDLALHRDFLLRRAGRLEIRVDGFNIFNRANLSDPVRFLTSPLFGQPASMLNTMLGTGTPSSGLTPMFQNGGARSFQLSLRWRF
jgi:hypothetical protein